MSESNTGRLIRINRVFPPEIQTRFANNFVIQHDEDNFFLSFFDAWIPIIIGTEEEKKAQLDALEKIDAKCVSRIVVSPDRARELVALLIDNIQTYERKFFVEDSKEME